jgi:7,8-dihydropterin-6-yl-methyl-4-(beta-D-ribofuranosyl)aminobenzene 5'-phosphate synthase
LITDSTDTDKRFTEKPLLAEHGFAALIELPETRILWDAGITRISLLENMRRMEIDPAGIEAIAISHGHGDHTASVTDLLEAMDLHAQPRQWEEDASMEEKRVWARGRCVSLVAHPAAFRERWGLPKDEKPFGPVLPPPREKWRAAGAEVVLSTTPYELAPGCWTTGEVPRRSFEKAGIPQHLYYRQGDNFIPDLLEDDQAIVINVKDKGLVVLSGCAHSGIVNTVEHARRISGVERVWAILGGFHLARASEEDIQRCIDAIQALQLQMVVPSHCTGFKARRMFAEQMPETFVLGLVGTTYLF